MVPWLRRLPSRPVAGSSLVELLIGTAVLGAALLGAVPARVAARSLARESLETELAHGLLDVAMDHLLAEGSAGLARERVAPGQPLTLPRASGLADARLVFTTPGHTTGVEAPAVLPVRLELTWTAEDGRQRRLQLTSATR